MLQSRIVVNKNGGVRIETPEARADAALRKADRKAGITYDARITSVFRDLIEPALGFTPEQVAWADRDFAAFGIPARSGPFKGMGTIEVARAKKKKAKITKSKKAGKKKRSRDRDHPEGKSDGGGTSRIVSRDARHT